MGANRSEPFNPLTSFYTPGFTPLYTAEVRRWRCPMSCDFRVFECEISASVTSIRILLDMKMSA